MQGAWKIISWAAGKGDGEEEEAKFTTGLDFDSPVKQSWIPGVEAEEEFIGYPKLETPGVGYPKLETPGVGYPELEISGSPGSSGSDRAGFDDDSSSQVTVEEPEDPLVQRFRKFLSEAEVEAAVAPVSPSPGTTNNSLHMLLSNQNKFTSKLMRRVCVIKSNLMVPGN